MKIVVIGGTGLLGSKIVEKLAEAGHDPLAAAPNTGVDTITGEGLADALEGADVVVDVANAPQWDDAAVLDFFRTSTGNIVAAEAASGVEHHVGVSIVGADRLPGSGYLRAKVAQEEIVRAAGVPYSIVRATQFFEFIGRIAESAADGDTLRLPTALFQPIAVDDLAAAIATVAEGQPTSTVVEVAGPERIPMFELARRVLAANDDPREVVGDPHARYFGAELDDGSLTAGSDARLGPTRFQTWLEQLVTA